jgi:hypothetical protein
MMMAIGLPEGIEGWSADALAAWVPRIMQGPSSREDVDQLITLIANRKGLLETRLFELRQMRECFPARSEMVDHSWEIESTEVGTSEYSSDDDSKKNPCLLRRQNAKCGVDLERALGVPQIPEGLLLVRRNAVVGDAVGAFLLG